MYARISWLFYTYGGKFPYIFLVYFLLTANFATGDPGLGCGLNPLEGGIYLHVRPRITDVPVADVDLMKLHQPRFDATPNTHVATQVAGDEPVIVWQIAIADIDEIEDGVVRSPLFEGQLKHPDQGSVRIALVPAYLAHHPLALSPLNEPHPSKVARHGAEFISPQPWGHFRCSIHWP